MSWYVIFVESGFEEDVCHFIDRLRTKLYEDINFNLLVPKRKIYERKQGVKREVIKKMFPGYVLVETDYIEDFYVRARGGPHILKFLKNSYNFLEVSIEEINPILKLVDNKGLINVSKGLIENDRIHIIDGPLYGREGIIRKLDKRKGRAKVEFIMNYNSLLIDLGVDIIRRFDEEEIVL
ncbi:MAG: transcription antiterminator [Anaerocolumna sp.]|jgi:transcriptional antiterminator NusG|nr:transcription antiterminator [Anaerocolumna sp.]